MSNAETSAPSFTTAAEGIAAVFDSAKLYARSIGMQAGDCRARASIGLPLETELDALALFVADFENWLAQMDVRIQAAMAEAILHTDADR